jgi:alpha-tubulin suppressor-like RCC1 family protein
VSEEDRQFVDGNRLGRRHFLLAGMTAGAAALGVSTGNERSVRRPLTAAAPSTAWRWGSYKGGAAEPLTQWTPRQVPNLSGIAQIAAGNSSSYSIASGRVWTWGYGTEGQLGDGILADSFTPVEAMFGSDKVLSAIGECRNTGFAIEGPTSHDPGYGWGWGVNAQETIGNGTSGVQKVPVMVPGVTTATAVCGGGGHVLWLLADGTVLACGGNKYGQLGTGNTNSATSVVPVSLPLDVFAVALAAGDNHSGAIDSEGNVWMWGSNAFGQLGLGPDAPTFVSTPAKVTLRTRAISLSGGGDTLKNGHTQCLLSDGSLWAWGCDLDGQLGDGGTTNQFAPVEITAAPSNLVQVVAGGKHSLALDQFGNVTAWGDNSAGQLGLGKVANQPYPTMIEGLPSGVVAIAATAISSLAL